MVERQIRADRLSHLAGSGLREGEIICLAILVLGLNLVTVVALLGKLL